jgi:hypothetical protein
MIHVLLAFAVFGFNFQLQEYVGWCADGPVADVYVCADDGRVGACVSLSSLTVASEYDCGPTGCVQ